MAYIRIGIVMFFVICVVKPRAFCLKCYKCESFVSWEDCEQHQAIQTCSSPVLDTCIKAHRYFIKLNGQEKHEFYKTCFHSGDCTVESCKATNEITEGRWCDLECCNTTLCNTGVTPWARKHMRQVGRGSSHVAYASTNQIVLLLLVSLGLVF